MYSDETALRYGWPTRARVETLRNETFEGYTVAEIAEVLGRSYHTVYGWVRRGRKPQWRITVAEFEALVKRWDGRRNGGRGSPRRRSASG